MDETLKEIDGLIRRGRGSVAREKLLALDRRKIPRAELARVAFLAYRLDEVDLGIRLLNPVVRSARAAKSPSPRERMYYALCLTGIGANVEALGLFKSLETDKIPEVLLYETFALVAEWNYAAAIPLLREYIRATPEGYQRLVGEINLLSALMFERAEDEAAKLLERILGETSGKEELRLVRGKALQLSAGDFVLRRLPERAEAAIRDAAALLEGSEGVDEFFLRKWKAIRELLCGSGKRAPLEAIREEALRRSLWETVRDCDRFLAVAARDRNLLAHVWYGTHYAAYRRWLLADFGAEAAVPTEYVWRLGPPGDGPVADLTQGSGQTPERLLAILCSDFYRPFRLAELHARLHPDSYFNPVSSPARVHTTVQRLRGWLSRAGLPLDVAEEGGQYRLVATGPCAVRVPAELPGHDKERRSLDELKSASGDKPFTAGEAAQRLGVSLRTAIRLLTFAVEESIVGRTGKARATRYFFVA